MGRSILGLDIRADSVCAVKISAGLREKRITAFARVPVDPPGTGREEWSAALDRLSREMDLSASNTIVAFPAEGVFFRVAPAPFREKKKIRQVLAFQMEPDMPLPVEELVFDFQRISLPEQDGDDQVLTAFAEKRVLDDFLATLHRFDVKPGVVTVGGYAGARVVSRLDGHPGHLIFADIGATVCTLSFIVSGTICYVRVFSVRGDGDSGGDRLARQIERTLAAFRDAQGVDFAPETLYYVGGGGGGEGLREALSRRLEIPVEPVDLSRCIGHLTLPWNRGEWPSETMGGAVALASAELEGGAGLNLFREGFAEKKYWREHRRKIVTAMGLAILAGALFLFNFIHEVRATEQTLDQLNRRITDTFRSVFPDVQRIVDPLHQMRLRVAEARNGMVVSGAGGNGQRVLDILEGLSRNIPPQLDVRLTRLDVGPESVSITGDSDTFNTVDEVKGRLAGVPIFKTVTITSTSKDRSGRRINFKLKVERYSEWLSD